MELGDGKHIATNEMDFLVIDCWLPYNIILGQPTLSAFEMVPFMIYLKAKFLNPTGIGICKGNEEATRTLYIQTLKRNSMMDVELGSDEELTNRGESTEVIEEIQLGLSPNQTTKIGMVVTPKLRECLITFLQDNVDMFSWSPPDMLGIPVDVITHQLNINPNAKPIKLKK